MASKKKVRRNVVKGVALHQGDVQQHAHHHHRSQRREPCAGTPRARSASRARARRRPSPPAGPARSVAAKATSDGHAGARGPREGPRPGPRVGGHRPAGRRPEGRRRSRTTRRSRSTGAALRKTSPRLIGMGSCRVSTDETGSSPRRETIRHRERSRVGSTSKHRRIRGDVAMQVRWRGLELPARVD